MRDGHVFGLDPQGGAGHADLGQARADRLLAREERRTASGAALLAIKIRKHRALAGDAIHVRRAIAHDAVVVAAQIEPPDVVRHDEENVRLARLCHLKSPCTLGGTPRRLDHGSRSNAKSRALGQNPLRRCTRTSDEKCLSHWSLPSLPLTAGTHVRLDPTAYRGHERGGNAQPQEFLGQIGASP